MKNILKLQVIENFPIATHHYYIHRRITTKRRKTGFSITVFLLHMAIFTLTLNANLFPFLLTIHFFVENFKSKIKQKISNISLNVSDNMQHKFTYLLTNLLFGILQAELR